MIGDPITQAVGTGPASAGVGWLTNPGVGCHITTDPGGILLPTVGYGIGAEHGARRGSIGPTAEVMLAGVQLDGIPRGGGGMDGDGDITQAIIPATEAAIMIVF